MFDRIIERFNERKELMERIEELEKRCEKLSEKLDDKILRVNNRIDKLERIIQHCYNCEPKVRIESGMEWPGLSLASTLYIYNFVEEFKIDMDDQERRKLASIYIECNNKYNFKVYDELAYITFHNDEKKTYL